MTNYQKAQTIRQYVAHKAARNPNLERASCPVCERSLTQLYAENRVTDASHVMTVAQDGAVGP